MNHRHSKKPSTGGGGGDMDKEHFGWGPPGNTAPLDIVPTLSTCLESPVVNAVKKKL